MPQPGSTAAAKAVGRAPAMNVPIYGTKRNRPANMPHNNGFGTPITNNPAPMIKPKAEFSPNWVNK